MDQRIWTKSQEKAAHILLKRGPELHQLKVTGNALTLKGNLRKTLEGLEAGADPGSTKAKLVGSLDAREIAKAELSSGGGGLTLHGPGEAPTKLKFHPGEGAGAILDEILAESGRTYESKEEEIGLGEALLAPIIFAVLGGLFWMGLYTNAQDLAAGKVVEVKGRRQGLQQLFVGLAGMVGPNGAIAIGVVLALLLAFWVYRQVVHRPRRTVLLPAAA